MEKILRECTRCGLQAYTEEQRQSLFVKDNAPSKEKFGFTKSTCRKCHAFFAKIKRNGLEFYGPHLIKRCRDCGKFPNSKEELEKFFVKDKSINDGYGSLCKSCRNSRQYRSNNKKREYVRQRSRKNQIHSYGISFEEYEVIRIKQKNSCAVCSISFDKIKKHPSIDHDHSCCSDKKSCGSCIRGLLCNRCNILLGVASDDIMILENAIKYLRR